MTRVDFYVMGNAVPDSRNRLVCKLAEKAFRMGHKVYIHTESAQQSQLFDDLLWTFRDRSFLPHAINSVNNEQNHPILLGHESEPELHHDVLINLASEVPGFFSRFERVVEVVNQDATNKQLARERYRFYRERGYPLESHDIADA